MTLSMRTVLVWGLVAGLVGGILALGFASAFGEPPVEVAISLEEQGAAHDDGTVAEEPAPVSRGVQRTIGLAIATCAFGIAVGGLFALAFAFAYGRIGGLTPRATALVTAAIAFVAVALVPFLNYPPNPPAVGREETIGDRTALYFAMVAVSVLLAVAAVYVSRRLGGWLGAVGSGVGYVVAVGVVAALLPHFDEVPEGFPAQVLWEFRLASLGTQAVLWGTIGVAFAVLLDREVRRRTKQTV